MPIKRAVHMKVRDIPEKHQNTWSRFPLLKIDELSMSLKGFTYCTCQSVRKAKHRKFPILHSGVIIKFSWLVGNVFRVVCHHIVNRGVIDCHVRDESAQYLTEFFL